MNAETRHVKAEAAEHIVRVSNARGACPLPRFIMILCDAVPHMLAAMRDAEIRKDSADEQKYADLAIAFMSEARLVQAAMDEAQRAAN